MKKYLLLAFILTVAGASQAKAQVLTGFGSADTNPFLVASDFLSPWTGTVNTTSLTVTGQSNNSGGIFDTLQSPVAVTNIAGVLNLTLTGQLLSIPGTSNFTVTVYDTTLAHGLVYNFNWLTFNTPTGNAFTGVLDLSSSFGTFNGTVGAWELDVGGNPGDTVSFRFDNLAYTSVAIPEPSTYAMLAGGLVALYFVRRRKMAAVKI